MDILFVKLILAMLAVLLVCCFVTVKKKSEYSGHLLRLMITAMITMGCYAGFLLSKSQRSAVLFDGLYFVGIDWVLLSMLSYVVKYTETRIPTKLYRNFLVLLALIDTVSMVVNVKTGHVFVIQRTTFRDTGVEYWGAGFRTYEYWHLAYCYLLVVIILFFLIRKLVLSSKMYRRMYLSTLIPLVLVIIVNAVCYSTDYPIDFSVLGYAFFGLCICYFTLYSVPRGLVEDILAMVVEDFKSSIVCYDITGKCVYANTEAYAFIGVKQNEGFKAFEPFYKDWKEKNPRNVQDYEQWEETRKTDNDEHHFHMEYQRLRDKKGAVTGHAFKATDRTAEVNRFRQEQYLATHDRLTGLYNREYFFQKAEQILKRSPEVERYMVCTNIQNFKLVNDLFGEETGDRVLVDQAALLKFGNYEDCIHGRIGADRFAMLITGEAFDPELAIKNTAKLQYHVNDSNYTVHVTIGAYKIEDPFEAPQIMYDKANMAIEAAKGEIQKGVVYYDGKMLEQLAHEKSVIGEFDQAIRENQFQMFLQPLVGVNGELKGAEALARWIHPARGLVMPVNFIPIVEKSGMIIRLDEYIWDLAARKLREWNDRGIKDVTISVNISAKDFYYTDLFQTFTGLVEKYKISPCSLNLEITESALMTDVNMHMETLAKLQNYGFYIELDDFGSGYSSLNMLKDIKADILKIDMLFLRETENAQRSHVILDSVISMAKRLHMSVITEGIETEEQLLMLKNMGCEIFQGYYFSKPVSVEDFENRYFGA